MRKYLFCMFLIGLLFCISGCGTLTESELMEYDSSGKMIRLQRNRESLIHSVMNSTKNKNVVYWESGWRATFSVNMATMEHPTPSFEVYAGKFNRGLISSLPAEKHLGDIANVIRSAKDELEVSRDGIRDHIPDVP